MIPTPQLQMRLTAQYLFTVFVFVRFLCLNCGPGHQSPFYSSLNPCMLSILQILPNVRHGWLVQEITDQILQVSIELFSQGT